MLSIRPVDGATELLFGVVGLGLAVLLAGCGKPRAFAPTSDFSQKHGCPAGEVETIKEGRDRVRVNGCGESQIYVRTCENGRSEGSSDVRPRPLITESEARNYSGNSAPSVSGCAWSRADH